MQLDTRDARSRALVKTGKKGRTPASAPNDVVGPTSAALETTETVEITFRSTPPGARVLAGDRDFGATPTAVPLPKGNLPLSFRFVLEGFEVRSYNVVPDADRPVSVTLRPRGRKPKVGVTSTPRTTAAAAAGRVTPPRGTARPRKTTATSKPPAGKTADSLKDPYGGGP